MAMHPSLSGRSFPFFWRVSIAEAPKRPRPPGGHHHRLEVDVAGEALGNWATVPRIMVDLAAVHWAARDEIFKRLLGKRSRVPLTVVTGLLFLGSVNAGTAVTNQYIYKAVPYDSVGSFAPIALVG